jgi:hypothetical protein
MDFKHKAKHETLADLHKQDGGMPFKHHHEAVADLHKEFDGGMPMQHHHEAVAKMCYGGMAKGKK